ncbi:MAG TPA: DUF11 domain-containing protein, partial [Roseiflexaceae bacterium]|nr:DUF11 domain-containing protein [Roseiflexaceae bacterium]
LTIVARVTQPGTIGNTATITGSDIPDPSSQDNTSTSTIVAQSADLAVTKQVNNVKPQIGGSVIYTITVHNNGPNTATGVMVADKLPAGLTFVASTPSQGSYDSNSGSWNVGSLANGATATLSIQVQVAAVGTIVNTAQISAAGQFDPNSTPANNAPAENDQSQASLAAQPTAILLDHFTAHSSGAGVLLNWRTTLELDTWGFEIYRSSTGQRDDAVRVTPTLIPAQGRGQAGAEYTWLDTATQPGSVYRYWLVEIDRNGIRTEYGPASSATGAGATTYRVALPLVVR